METSYNEDDNTPTRHHMLSNKTSKPGMAIHFFRSLAKRGPVDTHTPKTTSYYQFCWLPPTT